MYLRERFGLGRSLAVALAALALGLATMPRAAEATPTDTLTLTAPNNVTIPELDDYATQTLHRPANMDTLDDLSQPYQFSVPTVSGGIWHAVMTSSSAFVAFQFQNFTGTYSWLGQKDGYNYPINTSYYTHLWVRLNVSQGGNAVTWWYGPHGTAPVGNSRFIALQTGWNVYEVDLPAGGPGSSGSWTAQPISGFRFDLPVNTPNNDVQFDWWRITHGSSPAVQITWNHSASGNPNVNLYLSADPNANGADELLIATVPANNGSYTWTAAGMAPGTYYIHAVMNGVHAASGPLIVAPKPIVRIDAPSALTGEDYAAARLNTLWDENNFNQFPHNANVTAPGYTPDYIQWSATSNDPQVDWLYQNQAAAIDTSRYRYMNMRLWLQAPSSHPTSWGNTGPRMTWSVPINLQWQQTQPVEAPYNRWLPIVFDLPNVPLTTGPPNWTGQITTWRFDPHEQDDSGPLPDFFRVDKAHLTSRPFSNQATLIRWTPLQGSGLIDLYWDVDNVGNNGTLIVQNLPLSSGTYAWNTAGLANGTYWVYAVSHDSLGSSDTQYSLVPVIVDHGGASTIFTDVPTTNPFTSYISSLATRGILSGYSQSDTTLLFLPNASVTRGQTAKIVANAAGYADVIPPGQQTFTDVPSNNPFWLYIERAAAHGAISGYNSSPPCPAGSTPCFLPGSPVTRGQVAKIIANAAGFADSIPSSRQTFSDVPPGSPFWLYVERAAAHGVISGYTSSPPCSAGSTPCFLPGNNVTRGQFAKMTAQAFP